VEMPGADYMNPKLINEAIANKTATLADVDESVRRILTSMFAAGVIDTFAKDPMAYHYTKHNKNVTTLEAAALARKLSAESTVLLKNERGVLPIKKGRTVAIIGLADTNNALSHAGGSGSVVPSFIATPLSSFRAQYGIDADTKVSYCDGTNVIECVANAQAADVAVVFAGTLSSEGSDRMSLSLDDGLNAPPASNNNQNALIEAVALSNPDTVVVLSVPGAILCPWNKKVAAIVTNFMPGQQAGNAITDVLLGRVNPSGKLPITFPNKENETEFAPSQWPGVEDAPRTPPKTDPPQACVDTRAGYMQGFEAPASASVEGAPNCRYSNYTEKLLVGYRYYDHHKINFTTGFPFGHGLSYTTFAFGGMAANRSHVSFTLENTGKVAGAEVAQLYLGFPASAGEPPRQLKGFSKVMLTAGEKKTVHIPLTSRDLSIWHTATHKWAEVAGEFKVFVGSSSRNTPLSAAFTVA